MSDEIKIIDPHRCDKCGKLYGKSNGQLMGCDVWISCDCQPDSIVYLVNTEKIKVPIPEYESLSEPEYLHKVGNYNG